MDKCQVSHSILLVTLYQTHTRSYSMRNGTRSATAESKPLVVLLIVLVWIQMSQTDELDELLIDRDKCQIGSKLLLIAMHAPD